METSEKDLIFEKQCSERDRELVKRAYDTLMGNVYTEKSYLWSPFRCLSPGKKHFRGIWNWDSAFHAITVSRYDERLAKSCVDSFVKFMLPNGLLPDVIRIGGNVVLQIETLHSDHKATHENLPLDRATEDSLSQRFTFFSQINLMKQIKRKKRNQSMKMNY